MKFRNEIEHLLATDADTFDIAKLIKKEIKSYLSSLDEIFKERQGKDFLVRHTKQIDGFIELIYKCTLRQFFGNYQPLYNTLPLSLVAMGSHGREELCVYSDIDLMFVYKDLKGYNIEPMIEAMLYLAWDAGFKIGHRTHKVEELFEASKQDITIKTALLESRFLCGSQYLWVETQNVLNQIRKYKVKEFLTQKLELFEQRKKSHPLTMEPNIKDGAGGLRDANTLFWIANVLQNITKLQDLTPHIISEDEFRELRGSLEFIYRIRSALHLQAGKKQDVLALEYIPNVAKRLGFEDKATIKAQTALSKQALKSLWSIKVLCQIFIKRLTSPVLYDKKNISKLRASYVGNGFYLHKNRLYTSFHRKPCNLYTLLRYFVVFEDKEMEFDISVIYFMKRVKLPTHNSSKVYEVLSKFFRKSHLNQYLYAFYKAGIFGALFKPLKHTINLPQFDGYHAYPVCIHSLKCVSALENIEDSFIKSLYDDLCEDGKYLLRLVVLFHDSGKGKGGDHSLVGAKLFKTWAKKIYLKDEMIVIGDRLIRHHILMNNVANRQDIYSEKVIFSFLAAIKNEQTLKLLYILTYCDIQGVGQKSFSSFNARLLRELYDISLASFGKNSLIDEAQRRRKREKALQNNANFKSLNRMEKKKIMNIHSNLFFLKFDSNKIIRIAKWAFETKDVSMKIDTNERLSIAFIRKNYINITHLLEKLAFLNVIEMEVFDLFDGFKYFKIYFSENIHKDDISMVENLVKESMSVSIEPPSNKPTIYPDEISVDCEHSKTYAAINLNTKDQKGLLAFMMYIFDKFGLKISSAKIQTIKKRARNLFLIEKQGILCENKENIMSLLYTYGKTKGKV